jgi:nitrite reductase/ring-hydroxylating ferredoxin subunit/uncharacterized membrane protein
VPADALLKRVEANEALDSWADKFSKPLEKLLRREPVEDALTGRWLGHPVHPMAVIAPLSCWFGATVLDLLGGRHTSKAAERLVALGVVSALPAAAAGAADWLDTQGAERRIGLIHAASNSVALGLFALSWRKRRRGQRVRGMLLSLLGTGAAGLGGYLGGHLAYRRGVGVNTTAFQCGPTAWTPVIRADSLLDGKPSAVRAGGVVLVLARADGRIDCLENRCTHRGGPLHEGEMNDGCIRCPWHGSTFRLDDGSLVAGPASVPEPAYETRVRDGMVEVRIFEPGDLRRNPQAAEASVGPAPGLSAAPGAELANG